MNAVAKDTAERAKAEQLKQERFRYLSGTGPYAGADPFPTLVDRVESLLAKDVSTWMAATRATGPLAPSNHAQQSAGTG